MKTEAGCEYWTSQTDAEKITWDGDCKDGKVDGEGTLVLYKKGEVFYEFNGVILDGYTKKGEIKWVTGMYPFRTYGTKRVNLLRETFC